MYYLGVDVGSSKTHALLTDGQGKVLGFGVGGPGNHETVGMAGFQSAVQSAVNTCLEKAQIGIQEISSVGMGISGFDWPSQERIFLEALEGLNLGCPLKIVNDSCLGLLAGSDSGWGVALVAGTGCNCWGWNENRSKIAHVSGAGDAMGEGAGATELVAKAVQQVAYQWTTRGPKTSLSSRFMEISGTKSLTELIEYLSTGKYTIEPSSAPVIFEEANAGDGIARDVIRWAGYELGELAGCVIRQLNLEGSEFDLVLTGSLFEGGVLLISPLTKKIQQIAPHARINRLTVPPVVGAVILAMEKSGLIPSKQVRQVLVQSITF